MKRIYVIISSFFALAIVFTLCFYLSYVAALSQFNRKANENKLVSELPVDDSTQTVDTNKVNTITPFTNYIIKKYDVATGVTTTTNQNVSEEMIGFTREDMQNYCDQYMRNLPVDEQNEGLVSYNVESFSDKTVVVRKSYNSENVHYEYYMVIRNGYVTVFYKDKKTVFEYTNIEAKYLPQSEIDKLYDGIYVKNKEELYTILEGYSS